jgi:putative oxidoreductase
MASNVRTDGESLGSNLSTGSAALVKWAALPLRIIVGYGFLAHGLAKFEKGPDKFVAIVGALHVPTPELMAWLTIIVEVGGGLLMIAGAAISLVSIPMAAVLIVAIYTVHLPFGFTSIKLMEITASGPKFGPPGTETDLLYLACLISIYLIGPDPLSIDSLRAKGAKRVLRG